MNNMTSPSLLFMNVQRIALICFNGVHERCCSFFCSWFWLWSSSCFSKMSWSLLGMIKSKLQLEFCLTFQEEVRKKLVERLENLEAAVLLKGFFRFERKGCGEFHWDPDQPSLKGFHYLPLSLFMEWFYSLQRKFPATNQQKQSKIGRWGFLNAANRRMREIMFGVSANMILKNHCYVVSNIFYG